MAWYDGSWDYRVKVTVAATKVPSTQSNFTVFVDLSDLPAGFFSNVNSDGSDIRVTTSDETTEVPREVVEISTGSSTGQLHFKGTVDGTTDTDFYIYYGNSGASEPAVTATYGRNNVWTGYVGVWHMNETSGTNCENSTGDTDGTYAGDVPDPVTGQIGTAQDMDGNSDWVTVGANTVWDFNGSTEDFSVSCWVKTDTTSASGMLVCHRDGNNDGWVLWLGGGGAAGHKILLMLDNQDTITTDNIINDTTTFHHVVGVADRTGDGLGHVFLDGTEQSYVTQDSISSETMASTAAMKFGGQAYDSLNELDGKQQEVRITASVLSDDWITTEYNNQSDTSTFYTVGSQETDTPAAPVAAFSGTPLSGEYNLEVTFTDASTNTPTSWSWTFGDAGTSTSQNPSHTYTAAGDYTVSLTATNAGGSDGETKVDYVSVSAPAPPPEGQDPDVDPTKSKGTAEIATRDPSVDRKKIINLVPERGSKVAKRLKIGF